MNKKLSKILHNEHNVKTIASTIKKLRKTPNSEKKIKRYLHELSSSPAANVEEVSQKYSPF